MSPSLDFNKMIKSVGIFSFHYISYELNYLKCVNWIREKCIVVFKELFWPLLIRAGIRFELCPIVCYLVFDNVIVTGNLCSTKMLNAIVIHFATPEWDDIIKILSKIIFTIPIGGVCVSRRLDDTPLFLEIEW